MENTSKVYVLTDGHSRIIRCDGGYTICNIVDPENWVLIDEGYGDRYNLCQSNYFPDGLYTEDGIPKYKLEKGKAVFRSEAEITADREALPKPAEPIDLLAELEAMRQENAMLMECLLEISEMVYA